MTREEWLKELLDAGKIVINDAGCWVWQRATNGHGYGHVTLHGRTVSVHRLSYEKCVAALPPGLWVLHKCDNRPCCNPSHLFLGTAQDNIRDKVAKGRASRVGSPGESNGRARLTEGVVRRARLLATQVGVRPASRAISVQTGISANTLRQAIRGKTWRHL